MTMTCRLYRDGKLEDTNFDPQKIGAVREYVRPGDVLLIQHGHNRAQCRVIWSRRVGPTEIQMGVEFLKNNPRFWHVDLDEGRAGVWLSHSER